jgi:hypothetical protein
LKRRLHFLNRDPEGVTVLKLHGSMTWALIPEGKRLVDPDAVIWLSDKRIASTRDFGPYNLWDALDEPPFIVRPILGKQPLAEPFLTNLWQEAFNALVEAESVTVVGYSAPLDDPQARTLLSTLNVRARLRRLRYWLIDPDPSVAARCFTQVSPAIDYSQDYFSTEHIPSP